MKISRDWLQTFFEKKLPAAEQIADALTFHAFEIESIENDVLDVKITANRGHDCLSHQGIAKELSAILGMPLKEHPHTLPLSVIHDKPTSELSIVIDNPGLCRRYIGAYIRGAKVGTSPAWLVTRLESTGQKSINNVVDAANFVMFNSGQPLHAFDASKRSKDGGAYSIKVRLAHEGEKLVTLDDKEQVLTSNMLMIADGHTDEPLGVAGVKGGKESGVSNTTTDLILESANFDGPTLRATSRALKFRTDATQRFEQVISPELAAHGMCAFIELVLQVAGGELVGVTDVYPGIPTSRVVHVSLEHINRTLGLALSAEDVSAVFSRLGFAHEHNEPTFVVQVPFERLDLMIAEDLIEEVGRIVGYDKVPAIELPPQSTVVPNENMAKYAAIREHLIAQGFSEVFTSVFAERGERAVSNKIGGDKPYLRNSLAAGLQDALERNMRNKDLLGLTQVKIFEIGTVWSGGEEKIEVAIAVEKIKKQKTQEEYQKELEVLLSSPSVLSPERSILPDVRYESFSKYPFSVRDISAWVGLGFPSDSFLQVAENLIQKTAGPLLVRCDLFDSFEKAGRWSWAFRLVFQSFDHTLTEEEVNESMNKVTQALVANGFEIR